MTGVLPRRGHTEVNTHSQPSDGRGRDWSDMATSKECLEPAQAGIGKEGPRTLEPSDGVWPC